MRGGRVAPYGNRQRGRPRSQGHPPPPPEPLCGSYLQLGSGVVNYYNIYVRPCRKLPRLGIGRQFRAKGCAQSLSVPHINKVADGDGGERGRPRLRDAPALDGGVMVFTAPVARAHGIEHGLRGRHRKHSFFTKGQAKNR